jgi:hypothetical protein
MVDEDGYTIWLADFERSELELVDGHSMGRLGVAEADRS